MKALIHVVIFGGIIAVLNSDLPGGYDAFFGIALGCFYFYMPIEGLIALPQGSPDGRSGSRRISWKAKARRPTGAIVLIALGILFLMGNFGLLKMEWFSKVWPIGLVALGVWLLMDRMKRKTKN